jgi:hypothetical protein
MGSCRSKALPLAAHQARRAIECPEVSASKGLLVLSSAIRLFRTRNHLFWAVQKKVIFLTIGYLCACALERRFIRLVSPVQFVSLVNRSRTSDFYVAGWNNALLSISDRHNIRWFTSSFSYAGAEVDLVVFGLRPKHRLRDAFAFCLLYFASFLRALGRLEEAAELYRRLQERDGLLKIYGYLGLADLMNLVLLWEKRSNEMEARSETNFAIYGGLRNFLVQRQQWSFASDAHEAAVRVLCIRAARIDRSIPFSYYELSRYHEQLGNLTRAARFARMALSRALKRVPTHAFLEREACRLESLLAGEEEALGRFSVLAKGSAHLVKVISDAESIGQTADSYECGTSAEVLEVAYALYSGGSRKQIKKSLRFSPLVSFKVRSGFVPAFSGVPFVSDEGYTAAATTAYRGYPGRETFSPALWGGHGNKELFLERNIRFLKNIVCLPGVSTNFYHFVFDVLGSLSFVNPAELEDRQLVAFGAPLERFQKELLAGLRIPEEKLTMLPSGAETVRFENGLFPCYASSGNVANPHVARWLRSKLYQPRPITKGNRIYLARRMVRGFSTEDRRSILELMSRFGFRVVHPETMTISEIRGLLGDAEAVAIDIGAAAVNLLFAPPNAKVILIGTILGYTECFTPLSTVCQQDLHIVLGGGGIRPKYLFAWSDFEPNADIPSLQACLEQIF